MKKIISRSKYTIPTIPDIIERKRLFDLLDNYGSKKALFIIGQAAQGKSTLVASYVRKQKTPTIWIHLDGDDSDHNTFYNLFIRAFFDGIGKEIPNSVTQTVSLGPRKNLLRQKEVIKYLTEEITEPVNIIIDNTETLDENSKSFDLIYELINSNNSINLYIISRVMPPFNIQDLRIKQEIVVLKNSELSFSIDETRLFFEHLSGIDIDHNTAQSIKDSTEGWTGGLVLLSEVTKNIPKVSKKSFFNKEFPDLLKKESFEFFFQGVFIKQEESIKTLLIASSIFDVIIPDVLDKILSTSDSRNNLEIIERRNLFIHIIQDGYEKKYRFNSLFREFLKSFFENNTDISDKKAIYKAAGNVFESMEQYEEALKFYIKGCDHDRSCEMIIKTGTDFLITGRDEELASKIRALPKEYLKKETWIFFYLSLADRIKGGSKNLGNLKESYERFTEQDKLRGRILSLAFLIESSVFLGTSPEKLMVLLNEGKSLLNEISGTELFIYARALLWQHIGFAYIAGGLNFPKGLSACRNSYILAVKIKDTSLITSSMIVSAMGYAFTGEIQQSNNSLKKIDSIGKNISPEYRTLRNIVDISNSLNSCDTTHSAKLLNQCKENIESHGLLFLYPIFIELSGQFDIQNREYETALKTSNHLTDIAVLAGSDYYSGLSFKLSALAYYHLEEFEKAYKNSINSIDLLTPEKQDNYHGSCAKLISYLIIMNTNPDKKLFDQLEALRPSFNDPNQFERADILKALIIISYVNKDYKSINNLLPAISGEKYKIVKRTFLSSTDNLKYLMIVYALELGEQFSKEIDGYSSEDIKGVSLWVKKIMGNDQNNRVNFLKRLESYALSKVTVSTLGSYKVQIGDKDIKNNQWGGKKPYLLFKHILALGCINIPKDILIDALWPQSNSKSGDKNFKVNLHRLRKVFEEGGSSGSSYIILKHNNISLALGLFNIDFLNFEESLKKADLSPEDKNQSFYSEAEEIYGGNFLTDELYEESIVNKRDELQRSYIKVLEYLSTLSQKPDPQKSIYYNSKIISFDPLNEQACRRLIRLYKSEGNINSAIRIYNDLKENLLEDIGVDPENETIELFEKLK
jgi:DNA-binding SARP family transcriptional activator